jgi:hypothetical protein
MTALTVLYFPKAAPSPAAGKNTVDRLNLLASERWDAVRRNTPRPSPLGPRTSACDSGLFALYEDLHTVRRTNIFGRM